MNQTEQDAKRYQWLRSRDLETIGKGGVFAGLTPDNTILNGKDLDSEIDKAMKPNLKPVDLSVLIEYDIDCEFSHLDESEQRNHIDKLSNILNGCVYRDRRRVHWSACRPRMNHIHAFEFKSYKQADDLRTKLTKAGFVFSVDKTNGAYGIILLLSAFDKSPDHCWPWEIQQ